jgi:endonuclease/exonuclease/phosphatase family metal-dependent hydrolase
MIRLLSYNIRFGGVGRENEILAAIRTASPDVVIFQEATQPKVIASLAEATGMKTWDASPRRSVGFMSRLELSGHSWQQPPGVRRAYLELVLAGSGTRIYGVHLSPVHSNWTESWRARELKAMLAMLSRRPGGFHVLTGDFNTLAPGESFDMHRLPPRLRFLAWIGGWTIRWQTIQIMLDADYVDAFRRLHPGESGHTFPTWDPHIRLDYLFVPRDSVERLRSCEVLDGPQVKAASDHLPLLAEVDAA